MDNLYLIIIIAILAITLIYAIIVLINRLINKSNKTKAEEIMDELFKNAENDLAKDIKEYIENIDINNLEQNNPSDQFKIIESTILDYTFNKSSKLINQLLEEKFKDNPKSSIYMMILKNITSDKMEDIVGNILSDDSIKDLITEIYNNCFSGTIENIEEKDQELQKEFLQYEENADIVDETPEQHDQSIEEFAKSHLQEKIDEVNAIYDKVEQNNESNTVPVRDLSELKVLSYRDEDEEIIPPIENPDEESFISDVDEIIEYIEEDNKED